MIKPDRVVLLFSLFPFLFPPPPFCVFFFFLSPFFFFPSSCVTGAGLRLRKKRPPFSPNREMPGPLVRAATPLLFFFSFPLSFFLSLSFLDSSKMAGAKFYGLISPSSFPFFFFSFSPFLLGQLSGGSRRGVFF